MALSILDGNQSATTLSTILSSGQHITAHTVVSLGTQAITDIVNATSAGLTNTQLRASAVTVGGTVTVGNSVTISSLPAISGTVTANVFGLDSSSALTDVKIPILSFDVGVEQATLSYVIPVQISNMTGVIGHGNPLPISGTVTANPTGTQTIAGSVTIAAGTAQIGSVTASISNSVTIASLPAISGTVTANLAISSTAITSGSFASLTSATLVPGNVARKMATVYNLGAGQLFINAGATATTLGGGFMVALSSGDFYECDYTTTTLSAIFATAGTASWMSH